MAMVIPLTKGRHALVDDADYDWLSKLSWCAVKGRKGAYYAQTRYPIGVDKDGKTIYKIREMQRVIMDPEDKMPPRSVRVDHENHDTQDNCRSNLRWVSNSKSAIHTRRDTGIYPYRGIYYDRRRKH